MQTAKRRYDIDWIRVIAIGLLIIYHAAIGFQPWGMMIGFISTEKSWVSLWIPMSMLNVWRIPLLFFVSGMGIYFAMQKRSWKELLRERAQRIFVPYVFGIFCIVPIHFLIWQYYYRMETAYVPNPAHLWFLGNIFVYVLIFMPLFYYLKRHENGRVTGILKKIMCSPVGMLFAVGCFIVEVQVVNPQPYELYAMTPHGFFLGMLAFLFGFLFVFSGDGFWGMMVKERWLFFMLAISLFGMRTAGFYFPVSTMLLPVETVCWVLTVFAFGHRYLNRPGKAIQYLSQAAYPVYILHMIFLYLGAMLIFQLNIPAPLQFAGIVVFTLTGCFGVYEGIRRVAWLRLLFGLK